MVVDLFVDAESFVIWREESSFLIGSEKGMFDIKSLHRTTYLSFSEPVTFSSDLPPRR